MDTEQADRDSLRKMLDEAGVTMSVDEWMEQVATWPPETPASRLIDGLELWSDARSRRWQEIGEGHPAEYADRCAEHQELLDLLRAEAPETFHKMPPIPYPPRILSPEEIGDHVRRTAEVFGLVLAKWKAEELRRVPAKSKPRASHAKKRGPPEKPLMPREAVIFMAEELKKGTHKEAVASLQAKYGESIPEIKLIGWHAVMDRYRKAQEHWGITE